MLVLLMVALVPVLLVQAVIHYSSFQERQAQEFATNLELARSVAGTFDSYTDHILSQELAIGVAFTGPEPLPAAQSERLLTESLRGYPSLSYYNWVAPSGRVLVSTLSGATGIDISDRSYFQEIAGGKEWFVSNLLVGKITNEPAFAVARGIRDKSGVLLGVVVALVNPERLGDVLGVQRAGESAIAIIDGNGMGVYRYPEAKLTWEQRNWINTPPSMPEALSGKEVTAVFMSPVDEKTRMSGLAPIQSIGWVAGASRPVDEVMAPVIQNLVRDFALLLLVAGVAAVVALVIGRSITVPVGRLRNHALAVGRGELDHPLDVRAPNEMADLAAAFERMANEIAIRDDQREQLLQRLQETNRKLTVAVNEQNELMERREDLLRALSHDLRTPLTAIHGHAQMLQRLLDKAVSDDRAERSAQAVVAGARQMNAMIEDLVDSARLESGQLALNRVDVDLHAFVLEMKERLAGALETTRIEVSTPEQLPKVWADPARLERILTNLLSNALKYSPSDTKVALRAEEREREVIISIIDQGAGIAPDDLAHLFERYYRATGTRKTEGLGLGLYITKMLVEAHGGSLWAESTVGEGTTFHFTLPVEVIDRAG